MTFFKGSALFTDGGTHSTDGETTAGWGAVARSPDGRLYVMFDPVVTTEAHLAYAGTRLHTTNTAELSSIIEALSFLRPAGPVARGSQACIFFHSKRAANIQTRTNVPLGLTSQQLLLQAQLRLRIAMQHVYRHGQKRGYECADHAAALGALGLISNQNIDTRWVRPSCDSATQLGACGNMDEFLQGSHDVRRTHAPVQRVLSRSL